PPCHSARRGYIESSRLSRRQVQERGTNETVRGANRERVTAPRHADWSSVADLQRRFTLLCQNDLGVGWTVRHFHFSGRGFECGVSPGERNWSANGEMPPVLTGFVPIFLQFDDVVSKGNRGEVKISIGLDDADGRTIHGYHGSSRPTLNDKRSQARYGLK